jgi:hypothetical protein
LEALVDYGDVDRSSSSRSASPQRSTSCALSDGVATVNFGAIAPDDFFAHAAIVLSLTGLSGIRAVALRSNGKPCCVSDFESKPLAAPVTRSLYHGWSGEPCDSRKYPGAITCSDY